MFREQRARNADVNNLGAPSSGELSELSELNQIGLGSGDGFMIHDTPVPLGVLRVDPSNANAGLLYLNLNMD